MGHPRRLTDGFLEGVVKAVATGVSPRQAAVAAGASLNSHYTWIERGQQEIQRLADEYAAGNSPEIQPEERLFVEYAIGIERALAIDEQRRIERINKAAEGGLVTTRTETTKELTDGTTESTVVERTTPPDWKADAWMLERSPHTRDRYGRRERLEHSGPDGGEIPLSVQVSARQEFTEAVETAARRLQGNVVGLPRPDEESA